MSDTFAFDSLESRFLLDATLDDGVLRVDGTAAADTITLSLDDGEIVVEINQDEPARFDAGDVSSILVRGFDNDDLIEIGAGVIGSTIRGGEGQDTIRGSAFADEIFGGDNDDFIRAGKGNDTVSGALGDDKIAGQDGDDRLRGGQDSDFITGGSGDDRLTGGLDGDDLTGGSGSDTLSGGDDDDELYARDGDADDLDGGDGIDLFERDFGSDTIEKVENEISPDFNFLLGFVSVRVEQGEAEVVIASSSSANVTRVQEGLFTVTILLNLPFGADQSSVAPIVSISDPAFDTSEANAFVTELSNGSITIQINTADSAGDEEDRSFNLMLLSAPIEA